MVGSVLLFINESKYFSITFPKSNQDGNLELKLGIVWPRSCFGCSYIFSLALADLLVIITCVPFTSILYTVEYWPWGVVVCKVSETAKDISIGVSVFTLTALSAERYCAIVNPLRRLQVSESWSLVWHVMNILNDVLRRSI